MPIAEASFNGTVRTILVLVALWLVLRAVLRARARAVKPPDAPKRPKGDVRIEQASQQGSRSRGGDIIDADYEEIK